VKRAALRVLLLGYGNPGRLDDGLGPALAAALEARRIPGLEVESDYQLTVEDAHAVAAHDVVVFADADVKGREPFYFRRVVEAAAGPGFSSHGAEPEEVLTLARRLFRADTRAYVLGIRGYEFDEFGERLSARAQANLDAAVAFVERLMREESFETSVTE
jgi:hydrogenase maturation protease